MITPILIYFLKVNLALAFLYICYRLLFRDDTFFRLRRGVLLSIYLIAFLYPLPDLSGWLSTQTNVAGIVGYYSGLLPKETVLTASNEIAASDWKEAGLKFPENVKLISVFQNSPGDVSNFHTAIAYEKDGSIYIFEKQDPTLPYRWSRFNNWVDIKTHWLGNRFKVFKDNVDILVNDQKFDDFLKNTLYIPQNNQLAPQDK